MNTTNSAVQITHLPTGMIVKCQDERSQLKNKAKALKVLRSRLLEIEREKQADAVRDERRGMVRRRRRSEKIRTYNFPQNRLTDHRIGLTLHKLDRVMEGDLDELLDALVAHSPGRRCSQAKADGDGRESPRSIWTRCLRAGAGTTDVLAESLLRAVPAARGGQLRRRAARVRGIMRQLGDSRARAEIVGERVLTDGRVLLRYRVEEMGYTRTAALSALEAATLRYALHRSGKAPAVARRTS